MTSHQQSTERPLDVPRRDAFLSRVFGALIATMETQTAYLGLRLGYYEALARDGAATPEVLARRTGTDARYTREWLEQQAVAGFLEVDDPAADAEKRQYALPPEHAEVLLARDSTDFLGFVPVMTMGLSHNLPALVAAYQSGDGVAWESYGDDMRWAQGDQNRAFLRRFFAPRVLPALGDVHARLMADPPARVADIACGVGWAAIAIAEHYPKVQVDGLDLDEKAVEEGQRTVAGLGLADRVRLQVRDAASPELKGRYDLVTIVEALHDMSHPVEVLRAARALLAPDGVLVVVDENVLEEFTAPGPETERSFYAFSVLSCLPSARMGPGSAMTGAVMRPATLHRYAADAGFSRVDQAPVAHDFFRIYVLRP